MSTNIEFSTESVVTALRVCYERSCSFLTIKTPFSKKNQPYELMKYIKQFWSSRNKNKVEAQSLLTTEALEREVARLCPYDTQGTISSAISTLIQMEAIWIIDVDTSGCDIKKTLLAPLGLEIWKKIDNGTIFNQEKIKRENLLRVLEENLLMNFIKAERYAWIDLNQKRIAAPRGTVDSQAVCLGVYLLLNRAIAREHSLHLIRTANKDFKYHEILTQGLNVVATTLFGDSLFTIHSLKDDLQRRSELIQKVGPSFQWLEPKKRGIDEYYWWEVGDYKTDTSILEHIIKSLLISTYTAESQESLRKRMENLTNYFVHRVGYKLNSVAMLNLFSNPADSSFESALTRSTDKVLNEIVENVISREKLKRNNKRS